MGHPEYRADIQLVITAEATIALTGLGDTTTEPRRQTHRLETGDRAIATASAAGITLTRANAQVAASPTAGSFAFRTIKF